MLCGCWYVPNYNTYSGPKIYLPQVDLSSHTTILATTSRTILKQKFSNPEGQALDEVQYSFPLYDGVSVVGFRCTVASRTIVGVVKEKQQARAEYKEALDRGETAGLLEQLPEAADVFTTRIGNVPARESILVEVVYLGELKHDAETDGVRFTIPTVIAPRYGEVGRPPLISSGMSTLASDRGGIHIVVDVAVDEGSAIRGVQSPSHPIAVSMGRTSSTPEDDTESFSNHLASATLTLGSTELEKDFVIVVLAPGQDTPRAMLEHHPSIRDQRALMTTLVPRFNLPPIHPEIVFVVDRSGSMNGKIDTLVAALKIFLKSLPVGVKFNICSFGSRHTFLWPKSKTYDQSSLQTALDHLTTFSANYGGTEMLKPVQATVKNRYTDMLLEVMVITDGEIWDQQNLFDFINKATAKHDARFFSLGIGDGASSSLVEGIARAGDGFAQFVGDHEKMDKRVVRMLKGALTPHIHDYTLEVKYDKEDDEFEMIESVTDCLKDLVTSTPDSKSSNSKKSISLFSKQTSVEDAAPPAGRYDHLPVVGIPKLLQVPHKIPSLYPFNRTTVYLLMSAEACQRTPRAVVLRATSDHGPLELEIPVHDVGVGETVHQLAAKKAIHELEEGRGWITEAKDTNGKLIKQKHEGRWDEMVEREAVRLGVQFQVGGKWCSFVAVETNSKTGESSENEMELEKSSSSQNQKFKDARSKSSGPSQPTFFASSPNWHSSTMGFASSKPVAAGGLFGNVSASSGCGLFAQSEAPHDVRDDYSSLFRVTANSVNAPHHIHSNVFGRMPASTSKSSANVDSAAGSAPKKRASIVPQAAFASSSRFGSARQCAQIQCSSSTMLAASSPPSAPDASLFGFAQFHQSQSNSMPTAPGPPSAPGVPLRGGAERKITGRRGSYQGETGEDDTSESPDDEMESGDDDAAMVEAGHAPKPQTIEDRVHVLIALQEFDGSWAWTAGLVAVCGIDGMKLEAVCKLAGLGDDKKVRATVVAVAFLQTKAKAEEEVWEMVVDKAMGWLNGKVEEWQVEKVKEAMVQE